MKLERTPKKSIRKPHFKITEEIFYNFVPFLKYKPTPDNPGNQNVDIEFIEMRLAGFHGGIMEATEELLLCFQIFL